MKNVKKSKKVRFLELQVWQMISHTLYGPGTSSLSYLTCYNQYLMILHYPWLRVKNKPFSRMKNIWKSSLFGVPTSTSNFSDPIWGRVFEVGLLVITSTRRLCTNIKIDLLHPKPWYPKTHHKYNTFLWLIFTFIKTVRFFYKNCQIFL